MPARLDTATVFESTFDIYRRQATLVLPAALLVFVPVACLAILGAVTGSAVLVGVAFLAGIVAQFWFQGMVVEAVRDILDGRRDYSLDELLRSVTPVLGPLIGLGILAGIGIAIGFVLLIIPGLILLTLWALLAPVIVIERRTGTSAFGRSVELVRGNGFRVFGVIVVLFIIQALVAQILQTVGESAGGDVGAGIGQLIGNVIFAPLAAIAATVMYLQLTGSRAGAPGGPGALDAPGEFGAPGAPGGFGAANAPGRSREPGAPVAGGWAPPASPPAGGSFGPPSSGGFAPPAPPPTPERDPFGRPAAPGGAEKPPGEPGDEAPPSGSRPVGG